MTFPASAANAGESYLTILLGDQACGLPVAHVREILNLQKITPIAGQPAYVKGVIRLHEQLLPIIDLRLRLGFAAVLAPGACIIVVQAAPPGRTGAALGLIVDRVAEVAAFLPGEITPAAEVISPIESVCLLGLARPPRQGQPLLLLDVTRLCPAAIVALS